MKNLLVILSLSLISSLVFSPSSKNEDKQRSIASEKSKIFNFKILGKVKEIKVSGLEEDEAFKFASKKCIGLYMDELEAKSLSIDDNRKVDILNVCNNPNSTLQKDWYTR